MKYLTSRYQGVFRPRPHQAKALHNKPCLNTNTKAFDSWILFYMLYNLNASTYTTKSYAIALTMEHMPTNYINGLIQKQFSSPYNMVINDFQINGQNSKHMSQTIVDSNHICNISQYPYPILSNMNKFYNSAPKYIHIKYRPSCIPVNTQDFHKRIYIH